jgi:hypothetical protein
MKKFRSGSVGLRFLNTGIRCRWDQLHAPVAILWGQAVREGERQSGCQSRSERSGEEKSLCLYRKSKVCRQNLMENVWFCEMAVMMIEFYVMKKISQPWDRNFCWTLDVSFHEACSLIFLVILPWIICDIPTKSCVLYIHLACYSAATL